ncbi:MAG: hypothetical protein EBZ48_08210, partial [Proteobacteria bacterium]|nr:hypothetical protein [Pseudomonadota bacterium]
MCAEFILSKDLFEYARVHRVSINLDPTGFSYFSTVLPHSVAPVLRQTGVGLTLSAMQFSLTPAWARERKVPFATFNARLDSVAQKPTWRV